jgi:catechol 2,3-dioxygenase-like lactoylglutathione lyase family enzyme
MGIRSLDHLVLTVADIEATVRFYEGLGMQRVNFDGADPAGRQRTALRFEAQKLNLHEAGAEIAPHAAHPAPGSADLCFLVDSLEAVADALARAGVPIELGPVARTGAVSRIESLYVRDPDGNLVELSQTDEQPR